ncbi:mannitol dehydrogenase family protein [Pelagerythrobacter rhizovicinus]|uniref:Mannitol dehydrogenase family protein n=1 Tax=Pelagerythrobacter rhizovicinus TaxID=2268576 RepID=A0A4Q2KJH5_9SPHN|nr:mannitol dehydrogenase family protein [Pelagerythrobacter rhizovicinus]RXZ65375.1 mannitol dehydrogenase family protein [Pelagerythrobacter rhizovicinus]
MTVRLSPATLGQLPPDIERPSYERSTVRKGVVHLGIGAFHRAHQAVVFDDLIGRGDPRWGVRAASLRSPATRDAMAPQDGLYSLVVRDGAEERTRIIGCVTDVLVAPEKPAALVEALAAPETHIVTLTVTEKGYKLDPATGSLIEADPDVTSDLARLDRPRTAPGFLVAALALRRTRGLAPFTAISCDNLPENGRRLEAAVLAMAERCDPALHDWIADKGAFPQTMVDRIVPATDEADVERLARRIGAMDRAMVKTEPFTQWVIEGRFAGERPDFGAAGVQVTADVAPWETAKLRLLNGAHSGIAYLGAQAGIEFVDQFVSDDIGVALVEALWDEAQATLAPPDELDLAVYRRALLARFANRALGHRTRQIAMDGSQKLPQRLVAPLLARQEMGLASPMIGLAIAAWMRWQAGRDDAGERHVVDDPLADRTAAAWAAAADPADAAHRLLAIDAIFPPALAGSPAAQQIARWLGELVRKGAAATLAAAVGDQGR